MLLDITYWALVISVAYSAGRGVLAYFGADNLRRGDRFILGAWIGIVALSLALLAASLVMALSPMVGIVTAAVVGGTGVWLSAISRGSRGRQPTDAPSPTAAAVGVMAILLGASALASDPVTLYDALVYHVGMIRWLRDEGTVPGIALIHNRLAHVSGWFALAAPFDAGITRDRAANLSLGVALVLVGVQGATGAARIAARQAADSDWFLAVSSLALVWPVLRYNAASPSPDVATNALIIVVAWAMLVLPRAHGSEGSDGTTRWHNPRLIPFLLAIGASTIKLFALPAAISAALFYAFGRGDDRGARHALVRLGAAAIFGIALMTPVVAANVMASGCPLFPAPFGCVDAPFSIGPAHAAEYAEYIRNVARWDSRRSFASVEHVPWIGTWMAAHPVVSVLTLLAPVLAVALLRGQRRDGVRSTLLVATTGIALAAWQAPAPRFVYAYLLIIPIIAVVRPLRALTRGLEGPRSAPGDAAVHRRAGALGFVAFAIIVGSAYAVASQKVNIVSAIARGTPAFSPAGALVRPAAPEIPTRLYRWRVNDVDVFTAVPRPIADTLGFRSAINADVGFEKCSTAPLPCTPYLPPSDLRLRVPARGLAAGFVRAPRGTELSSGPPRCVGELSPPFGESPHTRALVAIDGAAQRCGPEPAR